ncbi:MAG: hypothetical protein ACO1TE_19495 [Prosthecobacter sp.]
MNTLRWTWMMIVTLWVAGAGFGICGTSSSSSSSAGAAVIPDGVYRDAGGLVVLTITGRKAVLETSLLGGGKDTFSGAPVLLPNGAFWFGPLASNHAARLFGRRDWIWNKDHFIVKDMDPPNRTLELRRQ